MNIIVCDDHPVVREGLTRILTSSWDGCGTVAVRETASGQALLEAVRQGPCDVVLLDVTLPGLGGLDVLRQLRQEHPRIPVLMLSVHSAEQYAIRALRAGASGYLTKNLASGELLTAVRTVVSGRRYLTPDVMDRLAEDLSRPGNRPAHESLSDREFQVLVLLATGRTVAEIARTLCLSYNTISSYRSRIVAKLGVSTQADLIKYGIQHDLVELS
jgi:DNA-binding NarL/FixJ family response regulator